MDLKSLQIELTSIYKELNGENIQLIRNKVKELLDNYTNNDWKKHVKLCDSKYNRELIYTSHEYDLVIITWCKNQGCAIHNHPKNGCTVKILQNSITEELYEPENMSLVQSKIYEEGQIMYIDDTIGYHRMCNKEDSPCISLHVYAPGKYKPIFFSKKSD